MSKTYRDILKWGDKRDHKIDPGTWKVIKEKFNMTDEDLRNIHLPGTDIVSLKKQCALTEDQLTKLKRNCWRGKYTNG
jgi:hypothetical protein